MRFVFAFCLLGALAWSPVAEAAKVHGATILDESKKTGPSRFQSRRDWDRTIRFFRRVYGKKKGIVWSQMDTPPGVKGIHIANIRRTRKWDGINIYQHKNRIEIFVIEHKKNE